MDVEVRVKYCYPVGGIFDLEPGHLLEDVGKSRVGRVSRLLRYRWHEHLQQLAHCFLYLPPHTHRRRPTDPSHLLVLLADAGV